MKLTTEEFDKILKELREVMKLDAVDKINSLVMSLMRENEDLKKSRDMWRERLSQIPPNKLSGL